MKTKSFQLFFALVLVAVAALSVKSVFGTEEVKKHVKQTVCCKDGAITGYSNDCDSGSGNCIDGTCNLFAGTVESTTGSCSRP